MINPELHTFLMLSAQINEMTPKVYSLCATQSQPSPKSPMCIAAAVPGTVSLWICHLPPGGRVVDMLVAATPLGKSPLWSFRLGLLLQRPAALHPSRTLGRVLLLSLRVRMCVFYHF